VRKDSLDGPDRLIERGVKRSEGEDAFGGPSWADVTEGPYEERPVETRQAL
jgi:hypothetical protein